MAVPSWRDPQKMVMGELFDYRIWKITSIVGVPAHPSIQVYRCEVGFTDLEYIHVDLGGEGYHDCHGNPSGFNSAINVNDKTTETREPHAIIPHLVKVAWPSYQLLQHEFLPFKEDFADYITCQGAPLPEANVSEIVRCVRPGGEVGLWIDQWRYRQAICNLAFRLSSYVETDPWDEFNGRHLPKLLIPVPGPTYMLTFSPKERHFLIMSVTKDGRNESVTDQGKLNQQFNTLTTFKIRARTFLFAWSSEERHYIIQELFPRGKLGPETHTGDLAYAYDTVKAVTIGGGTYLFSHSQSKRLLIVRELLEGGKLGGVVHTLQESDYHQMITFTHGSTTFIFTFNTRNKWWTIQSISHTFCTEKRDQGQWKHVYNHAIISVKGKPFLFGIKADGAWFLRSISRDGKMEGVTDTGVFRHYYSTLSSYTYGKRSFLFAQNADKLNWVIYEILDIGRLGNLTCVSEFSHQYKAVDFYTQYA